MWRIESQIVSSTLSLIFGKKIPLFNTNFKVDGSTLYKKQIMTISVTAQSTQR